MSLALNIILLALSFSISVIALIRERINMKEKDEPTDSNSENLSKKSNLFPVLLYLNIGFVTISLLILLFKNEEDLKDKEDHKTETKGFQKNDSLSLQNDTIALVSIKRTIRQLDTALQAQRMVAVQTTRILHKNDSILQSQANANNQIDQILNPITELIVEIETEIPFEEPEVKDLKEFIYKTKHQMENDTLKYRGNWGYYTQDRNIIGWTVKPDTITQVDIEDMKKIHDYKSLNLNKMFYGYGFELSFIKYPIKRYNDFDNLKMRRMIFQPSEIVRDRLSAYLEFRKFHRVQVYKMRIGEPLLSGTPTILGFNDLKDCAMLFVPFSPSKCFLTRITIQSTSGLKNSYQIEFDQKDKLEFNKKKEKKYTGIKDYFKNYTYADELMQTLHLNWISIYFHKLDRREERPQKVGLIK